MRPLSPNPVPKVVDKSLNKSATARRALRGGVCSKNEHIGWNWPAPKDDNMPPPCGIFAVKGDYTGYAGGQLWIYAFYENPSGRKRWFCGLAARRQTTPA